ncbi:unnamed protein product [Rodentolepis nana]|uniref:Na_Ca_ex domain-containing protein n=1 Tax=Rodentolepis nana TaxID=102285 RepID=A0A0R3TGS5_RODNA|nr:unnamed protein product [Rodentolepis nana]
MSQGFFIPLLTLILQGWITCCNVLSDLYAMGVADCDNMLLLIGIPTSMEPEERTTITSLMMQGFQVFLLNFLLLLLPSIPYFAFGVHNKAMFSSSG